MTKVLTAFLGLALLLPAIAIAQESAHEQNQKAMQQQQNQAAETNEMGATTTPQHKMTGMVSNDGKTLTSGNTSYVVNNPKSLKKYDNQNVSVVYQFNPNNNNTIHVVSATPEQ